MANRTKCENSSHYSESLKGQQGKSVSPTPLHNIHSSSSPSPSLSRAFFTVPFMSVAMVPLLHARLLSAYYLQLWFQLQPRTVMDDVLFPPQMGYICMGCPFLIMMWARHGKHKRKMARCSFSIHYSSGRKKNWLCERLRCMTCARSSHSWEHILLKDEKHFFLVKEDG
jgi:hypothetical protein